jgi:hypothetical protein
MPSLLKKMANHNAYRKPLSAATLPPSSAIEPHLITKNQE